MNFRFVHKFLNYRNIVLSLSFLMIIATVELISVNFGNDNGKIWALLVAGSSGYHNYRHQADICHAYQILKSRIPEENIIVMMYNDIAYNLENPTPGIIINQPEGKNVYAGVKIDYEKDEVNPQNFINILKGNYSAMKNIGSGNVINSNMNDNIFVNFVDHGAPGFLNFPKSVLYVSDLIQTLMFMIVHRKFKKMILYVEACHAGSMFDEVLSDNQNIFVMSASDPFESSYACYYDRTRKTYLGDVFSVNWMNEAENEILSTFSLNHLFEKVRSNTTTSHVEEYGDLDIGNTLVDNIIGFSKANNTVWNKNEDSFNSAMDTVSQFDVPLSILQKQMITLKTKDEIDSARHQIITILKKRRFVKYLFEKILLDLTNDTNKLLMILREPKYNLNKHNMFCYKKIVKIFSETCLRISENPYISKFLHIFVNICNEKWINLNFVSRIVKLNCLNIPNITNIL